MLAPRGGRRCEQLRTPELSAGLASLAGARQRRPRQRCFETSAAGVYAAGDVASVFDPLYGRHRRIDHWSNAAYQGAEVGKVLAGRDDRYDAVSSFFSEVFDLGLKVFGDLSDFDRLDSAGSVPDGDFVATYWEDGRLAGALTIGQSAETEERLKQLIAARAPLVGRRPQRVLAGSAS